jgi:hypothetical protein
MSRERREQKREHYAHDYERIERSLPGLNYYYLQCKVCSQVVYPIPQLQKLTEYSEKHQFMFLQDWVLALLYSQPMPMIGITSFLKQLFLLLAEFAPEHNIPTENPGFRGYKFGPYSERMEDVIIGLEDAGLIETAGRKGVAGEYFFLTEIGKKIAKKSYDKLTEEQRLKLQEERRDWHQLGVKGLLNYIYRKYPDLAKESLVLEEVLRVLHKRRIGRKKWVDNQ